MPCGWLSCVVREANPSDFGVKTPRQKCRDLSEREHKKIPKLKNLDHGTGLAHFFQQRRQKPPALNHLADASPRGNFPMENQKPEAVHNSVHGLFFSLDDLFPGA